MSVHSSPSPNGRSDHGTADGPTDQVLTARATDTLREEAVTASGLPKEWGSVMDAFEEYIMKQNAASDTWESEKKVRPSTHRFTPEYAKKKEGKIRGGLRCIRDDTPDALPIYTVLLTRTGWPYDSDGNPAPPADFLDGLKQGRKSAHRRLRRTLDDWGNVQTWGRVTVCEPHSEGEKRSGFPHAHDGLVVVGTRELEQDELRRRLRSVIDTYVKANPFARPRDHGEGALTVMDGRRDGNVEGLGAELTNNLVGYEFDTSDSATPLNGVSDAVRRFSALMWVTGRSTVTFGKTFRKYVGLSQADWSPDGDGDESPRSRSDTDYGGGTPTYVVPDPCEVAFTFPDQGGDGDSDE